MVSKEGSKRRVVIRGAWTAEEDRKLAHYIEKHGAKNWKTVAAKTGLSRGGKSCRLRWLNYLRPNIKRGNISLEEEDLILRLHKLLGNRLPGRTDNEIKNYWNSHLSKKVVNSTDNRSSTTDDETSNPQEILGPRHHQCRQTISSCDNYEEAEIIFQGPRECDLVEGRLGDTHEQLIRFDVNGFFDFPEEYWTNMGTDWINTTTFLELDHGN